MFNASAVFSFSVGSVSLSPAILFVEDVFLVQDFYFWEGGAAVMVFGRQG